MGIVIPFSAPARIEPLTDRLSNLIWIFANERRVQDDVFWLKENAELLNILECTGQRPAAEALAVHQSFYARAMERLRFFPQYYRFLLSLALDLEDLGLPGTTAEEMVAFAAAQGLPEAELSDLQRAEARRLMARRGGDTSTDAGLDDRLRAFASRAATFALPNKKAAYELTHIVFYLSEYGRRDPNLPKVAKTSLHFTGLTAFMEQNADLLAEVCIALIQAGEEPPAVWTTWLGAQTRAFATEVGVTVALNDDYHEFLVSNWHAATSGSEAFRLPLSPERTRFDAARRATPLREISVAMLGLEGSRSDDWHVMRGLIADGVSEDTMEIMDLAAASSPHFDQYFAGFSRAGAL